MVKNSVKIKYDAAEGRATVTTALGERSDKLIVNHFGVCALVNGAEIDKDGVVHRQFEANEEDCRHLQRALVKVVVDENTNPN